jgi:hypothetical protein
MFVPVVMMVAIPPWFMTPSGFPPVTVPVGDQGVGVLHAHGLGGGEDWRPVDYGRHAVAGDEQPDADEGEFEFIVHGFLLYSHGIAD